MKRPDSKLYSRWSQEMRRCRWFRPGDRIGIGVSGGPDSMLLLSFMRQLGVETGFLPSVVHFNHHLRGEAAGEDEEFVAAQAGNAGLEFIRGEAPVARIARERRRNLEATARELRYGFFFGLVRQGKVDKLATAHTANDQAETVLLRLFRGAGARGLGGIHPVLGATVFRPFLGITRVEIEEEIARRGVPFRVDLTNQNLRFTRNRIRHEILPLLQRQFNPAIVPALKRFADRSREDEEYIDAQAQEHGRPWRTREQGVEKIPLRPLAEFHPAIAKRVLRQMVQSLSGGSGALSSRELEELPSLAASRQGAARLDLACGLVARRELDWLVISNPRNGPKRQDYTFQIRPPAEISLPQARLKFSFRIAENHERSRAESRYNWLGCVSIDFEKLSADLVLRNWREGDRFQLPGRSRPAKLKEIFLQRRVPGELRRSWPVLLSGESAIWVRGFPPADRVAATPASRRVLMIEEHVLDVLPTREQS
ncbi:MAG: tRNA lysidine(34) synthetase TilS [Terriglobia bacterium]